VRRKTPHAFFWLLAGAMAIAIVAAALAPDRAPALALYWNPIHRAEVALVVFALVYLLADSLDEVIDRVDELAGGSDPPDPGVP